MGDAGDEEKPKRARYTWTPEDYTKYVLILILYEFDFAEVLRRAPDAGFLNMDQRCFGGNYPSERLLDMYDDPSLIGDELVREIFRLYTTGAKSDARRTKNQGQTSCAPWPGAISVTSSREKEKKKKQNKSRKRKPGDGRTVDPGFLSRKKAPANVSVAGREEVAPTASAGQEEDSPRATARREEEAPTARVEPLPEEAPSSAATVSREVMERLRQESATTSDEVERQPNRAGWYSRNRKKKNQKKVARSLVRDGGDEELEKKPAAVERDDSRRLPGPTIKREDEEATQTEEDGEDEELEKKPTAVERDDSRRMPGPTIKREEANEAVPGGCNREREGSVRAAEHEEKPSQNGTAGPVCREEPADNHEVIEQAIKCEEEDEGLQNRASGPVATEQDEVTAEQEGAKSEDVGDFGLEAFVDIVCEEAARTTSSEECSSCDDSRKGGSGNKSSKRAAPVARITAPPRVGGGTESRRRAPPVARITAPPRVSRDAGDSPSDSSSDDEETTESEDGSNEPLVHSNSRHSRGGPICRPSRRCSFPFSAFEFSPPPPGQVYPPSDDIIDVRYGGHNCPVCRLPMWYGQKMRNNGTRKNPIWTHQYCEHH